MSKEKRRVPKLRFPGFTEDWEQRKLDDIAKIKTGGGTPKTANPEYWSGNIPWIQSSDLVEGDIVHVNINKFINNNALKNSAAKLISRDSIALVTRVGVGKVAVINQDFTTSQDFLSLSDFDESDIKFLAYQLYRLMQENAKVLQGTSIKGITKTELIEQSISIPSSSQEQNLISNVLLKIDSIITLHQRKLDNLKLKKKALLQKLFPKNGERYPELRFPGFTDAWEQRKLISLYKTIRNAFVGTATPYYTNDSINGYFYLESNNVKNGKINRNNEIYITKDFYQKQEDKLLYKDDIVIVQSGHVGHTAVIPEELDKMAAHALIMLQNKKENFDSHFINNSFQTPLIRNKIDEITTGNTIKHILASDVKNIVINMPSFKEQKLISQLFKLLDLNITLHQRKLDHLQLQKKALLQQMFV